MPQIPDPYELLERVSRSFPLRNYLNPTVEIPNESVPIIDLGDEQPEGHATDGSTVRQPSLPQYVLERFSRSLIPLRDYLNPSIDSIPKLDLAADDQALDFWGEDGGRVDRFLSGDEDQDDDDDDESTDDESMYEEEEEEDGDEEVDDNDFELPGHR